MSDIIYSTQKYEDAYTYRGDDLGMRYTDKETRFRVWAPSAKQLQVRIYETGDRNETQEPMKIIPMERSECGTWTASAEGDWNGFYYTYLVEREQGQAETMDPYAVSAGVNGKRAMILDMQETNPAGWEKDKNPNPETGLGDAIIYEAHVRDYTISPAAGVRHKGKFLGLAQENTQTPSGKPTGLSYLKELGITHLHLLPICDYASVDEAAEGAQYNWGYDPMNYNVPEGSYATDAYHGEVRVKELKQMIQTLHQNGISVIMDVVYNHVYEADQFSMNLLEPGYFSRIDAQGKYSNGSFCGNDTATERSMVRKYIVDSILYWTKEYHMDGFRFDLVGLIDIDTINELVTRVHDIRPDVIFYGEGWDMATDLTREGVRLATQNHAWQTPGFAYFNDSIRDTIKGSIMSETAAGYVSGERYQTDALKNNLLGLPCWSSSPRSVVQYMSCHDDLTLYDKLSLSMPHRSRQEIVDAYMLGAAILFASMGTVFFPQGEELLRSKRFEDGSICSNSYRAGDFVNQIDWSSQDEKEVQRTHDFYQQLIRIRRAHPALRMQQEAQIRKAIDFKGYYGREAISFTIDCGDIEGETAQKICVIFNPENEPLSVSLTQENWEVLMDQKGAIPTPEGQTVTASVTVPAVSSMYLMVRK